jgi:hypothetical protein
MLNARVNRAPLTRPARLAGLAALLAVTIPIAGFVQASFVTLSGTVVDPNGRLIAGVELVLTDTLRDAKHQVKTDTGGRFEFVGLPAGDYALGVYFAGFMPIRDAIALNQPVEKGFARSRIDPETINDHRRRRVQQQPLAAAVPRRVQPSLRPAARRRMAAVATADEDHRCQTGASAASNDRRIEGVVVLAARIGADAP